MTWEEEIKKKRPPALDHLLRDYEERGLDDEGNPKPKNHFVEMVESECESLIRRAKKIQDEKHKQEVLDALDELLDLARRRR